MNDPLATLLAEREIARVFLRYAKGVDTCDWELVRSCFHPDARIEWGDFFAGDLDEGLSYLQRTLPNLEGTLHSFATPSIELDLERGVATCETRAVNAARYAPDAEGVSIQNVSGTLYLDRFERRGGEWRLTFRRNERQWVQNTREAPEPPPPASER